MILFGATVKYFAFLFTIAVAFALTLESRGEIASNVIVGFPEAVPSSTLGELYLNHKPYLEVVNGCVPLLAVDAAGETKKAPLNLLPNTYRFHTRSAGLGPTGPTGPTDGNCSSSTGLVHTRTAI